MNEDQDFNESLESERSNLESMGQNDSNANEGKTSEKNHEGFGEAVIGAAEASAKAAKIFKKKQKKSVDDEQNDKINELVNDLQRTRADFENFRRQTEIQKTQYGNVVKFATVKKVLPLLDDIERAIAANPDTLAPLTKSLEKTIKELGLTEIPSDAGAEFNPDLHDAVMVEGDGDNELIGETLRTGYYYENEVLRPTMVKVSKQ
ncbi:MAG: nucleotide exchange factor GrpE [Candidatus Saccharibacteria bacterium]|nr:nucleotide exchange factor GrpE [Candidatus Saccharibacteria bacterium]